VDGEVLVGINWTALVDWLANHVDDASESLRADGHHNWRARVGHWLTADEALS